MTPAEIILAAGSLIMAVVAYLNYKNTARKDIVTLLQAEVARLSTEMIARDKRHAEEMVERDRRHAEEMVARDAERRRLRNRVRFLGKLAMDREKENNRSLAKIEQWYAWSRGMGRAYNKLWLELSALKQQLNPDLKVDPQETLPMPPPLPPTPDRVGSGNP